ncbi:MAG TPA: PD-(D/E)XK nuclease family protein [Dermatophilaceae bacterium]|nr:PD-(D/E)XK nuclease family protein [Dermatophilaceae bacterium]
MGVQPLPPTHSRPAADPVLPLAAPGARRSWPSPLYRASPSRMAAWLDCPRRYRMTYLDRPVPTPRAQRAHTSIGVVTHGVLRDFWDLPPERRTPQEVRALVSGGWVDVGFRDADQSARWQRRVGDQIVDYLRGVDRTRQPAGLERTVAFRTASLAFTGRVDRLDERAGRLTVVDYKTGRAVPVIEDALTSLALGLYAAAVSRMWRRACLRVELHHLPTGTVVGVEHSEESLARKVAEAESIVRDLVRADACFKRDGPGAAVFPTRPGPLCPWCDLRRHCPEGQRVGPEKSSWAGLDGEDDADLESDTDTSGATPDPAR